MESVESNIGNTKQPLYDGIRPYKIYYSEFYDDLDVDDVVLPYGQDLKDQNTEEVDEAYVEAMYEFIGTHILTKIIGRKRYHYDNLVCESNNNSFLDTRLYYLEFLDGR